MSNRGARSVNLGNTVGPEAGTLADFLDSAVQPGALVQAEANGIRCLACGHRCLVKSGRRGICKVRFNREGTLMVPHEYVAGVQCDPIEKKPLYHVLPGGEALTFGMLGCDFHCGYCQNWVTSQALRDKSAGVVPTRVKARDLVDGATKLQAKIVASSYNVAGSSIEMVSSTWGRLS